MFASAAFQNRVMGEPLEDRMPSRRIPAENLRGIVREENDNDDEAEEEDDLPPNPYVQRAPADQPVLIRDFGPVSVEQKNPVPTPVYCRLDDDEWNKAEEEQRRAQWMSLQASKKRKRQDFAEDINLFQIPDEAPAEPEGEAEEEVDQEIWIRKQRELEEEATDSGWCFLCRYGQDVHEREMNPDYERLVRFIDDHYGKMQLYVLATQVQQIYNSKLRPHCPEQRHWSLKMIRQHIEDHNPSRQVDLAFTLRATARAIRVVAENEVCFESDDGRKRLDNKGTNLFMKLAKQQLELYRALSALENKK